MKHYTEAELLELYYIPGGLVPAIRHLPDCASCSATFDKLQQKLHNAARTACSDVVERKPETFWARQRIAIMRSIERQSVPKRPAMFSVRRIAVAAILVLLIGGSGALVTLQMMSQPSRVETPPVLAIEQPAVEILDLGTSADPWSSAELQPYSEVVEWESWVSNEVSTEGTL